MFPRSFDEEKEIRKIKNKKMTDEPNRLKFKKSYRQTEKQTNLQTEKLCDVGSGLLLRGLQLSRLI